MEDMISKIIERDKEVRESIVKAKQSRIEAEKCISEIKDQKRNEYIAKARINIQELEKEEKLKAAVKLKIIENSYEKKRNRIEEIYTKNKEKWIGQIVDRVIQI